MKNSKRVFLGVFAAVASMGILACQPAFKMNYDSSNKGVAVNTQAISGFSAKITLIQPLSTNPDGTGSPDQARLSVSISATNLNPRTIQVVQNPATGSGTIQNQGNEPAMDYLVRCTDGPCSSVDTVIYFRIQGTTPSVLALAARYTLAGVLVTSGTVYIDGKTIPDHNLDAAMNAILSSP